MSKMDNLKLDISLEPFICRIPAMFAYIEWNEDGTTEIHKATDSPNGCYGKFVENICMPQGVRLTNYVLIQEDEIPVSYEWNEENTIRLSENPRNIFSSSGASYLRRVLWYVYVKTDEEYPDAEEFETVPQNVSDESPDVIKTIATDINGIQIDCDDEPLYDYYVKTANCLYYKREDIISPCKTYSYRTIISEYYKYKDIVGLDNSFIKFVNLGIGLINVDRKLLNLMDEETYCEVPETVYLSQVRGLLDVYREYQTASRHYEMHYVANERTNSVLLEKHKKYIRMGGDNMTNWLSQLLQKAYDVADEYKCHSDNKDFGSRFGLNLMLNNYTDVTGIESVCINEFYPGKRYYDGDLLTHNGLTYVCVLDGYVPDGNNYKYVVKNGKLYELNGDRYMEIYEGNVSYVDNLQEHATTYVIFKDNYYKWVEDEYVQIDVVSYCTGFKDEELGAYVFDEQHFVLISEMPGYEEWYDDENVNGDKYRFFVDVDVLPSVKVGDYVRLNDSIFYWDDVHSQYVSMEEGNESYVVQETTNSKLRDLRIFREYVNPFGVTEEPGVNEDWLFFYKVGNVTSIQVETDELGNIVRDTANPASNEYCYDLHAYGNVINSITYNQIDNSLTFEYIVGAHLKAVYKYSMADNDDNIKDYYGDFEFDEGSEDGVRFVETYYCEDDSVSDLGADFNDYVNGDRTLNIAHKYDKFPFTTLTVTPELGAPYVKGEGNSSVSAENNLLHMPVVREEWMAGLYHQPKVKNGISIDRGNGASFERHLRLGEIDSMEDLEKYHNGGFYTISEN